MEVKPETPAEAQLLEQLGQRSAIVLGSGSLPKRNSDDQGTYIRADYLRHILISATDAIDPFGFELQGAFIDGDLDLNGLTIKRRLSFTDCQFRGSIQLVDASLLSLFLYGCRCGSIHAERTTIKGNFELSHGFQAAAGVVLATSTLHGDLQLRGVDLYCERNEFALKLTGTAIKGSLVATFGAKLAKTDSDDLQSAGKDRPDEAKPAERQVSSFHGPIRAYGLSVYHNLEMHGVQIHPRTSALPSDHETYGELEADVDRYSLNLENASIAEALLIRNGTRIGAGIRLLGASVGNIEFNETSIYAPETPGRKRSLPAIDFMLCRINGRLRLDRKTLWKDGSCRLNQTSAQIFDLDPATWQDMLEDTFNEAYELDGFTYERFAESTRNVGPDALNWLKGQTQSDPGGFATQPWAQTAKVLAATGLDVDARKVRIEGARRHAAVENRQRWITTRKRFGTQPFWQAVPMALLDVPRNLMLWTFAQLYDALIQYGHNPLRAGFWLLVCVTLGAILLHHNQPLFVEAKEGTAPPFDPIMLALDVFIPVVKLGWDGVWVPKATEAAADWLWYFLAAFRSLGWIIAGFAVAGFTGLARK